MQNDDIFKCKTESSWIEKKLKSVKKIRGYRSQMAQAADCQPAYLSQVLGGKVLFTMEQAEGLCEFWNFDDLQGEYWMNLVQLSRAGSPQLKARIQKRLQSIRDQFFSRSESEMLIDNKRIFKENTLKYYSHWIPTALHMLWMIPEYNNNIKASAQRLNISQTEVTGALNLLVELGLFEVKNQKYSVTSNHLHIASESIYSSLHHRNWRTQALQNPTKNKPNRLHFTSIYSLDEKTLKKLIENIREFLTECDKEITKAPETTIACLNLDLFEV